jgi:hypothetical protein
MKYDNENRKRKNKRQMLSDLPWHLRGPAQNKYGGHQLQHLRGFRGSKYGPASECRTLTGHEKEKASKDLRDRGII